MTAKELLGTAALVIGLLAGAVQLIDWLLPKSAVDRLSHLLTHVWVWLVDQQAGRLLKWLRDSRPVKWLILAFFTVALVICIIILSDVSSPTMAMPEVVTVVYGVVPGLATSAALFLFASYFRLSQLADWITSKATAMKVLGRLASVCVGGAALLTLAILFFDNFAQHWEPLPFVVAISFMSFMFLPVLALTALWVLMLAWLVLVGALAVSLWVSEFFVRKLLENPKGPVLAVGALLAAFGGILKNVP